MRSDRGHRRGAYQPRPAIAPTARAALCVLAAVVHGACASPLDELAPAWRRVATTGPPARWGHAAVYDGARDRMLVFGGQTAAGESAEVWALDLATERWALLSTTNGPAARVNPAAIVDVARNRMVVVDGRTGATGLFADAWALDLATLAWTQLPAGPGPRQRAHAATDGTRAWFYGGEGFLSVASDLWELDLAHDTWRALPGEGPGGRTCGAFAYAAGGLVFTGGHDVTTPRDGTFRYDLAAARWSRVETFGGTAAGAHWAYATDAVCGRMYLAGGDHLDNYDSAFTDSLGFADARFARLATASLPPVHDHATLIVDPARHALVLYGGTVGDGQAFLGGAWVLPLGACP